MTRAGGDLGGAAPNSPSPRHALAVPLFLLQEKTGAPILNLSPARAGVGFHPVSSCESMCTAVIELTPSCLLDRAEYTASQGVTHWAIERPV